MISQMFDPRLWIWAMCNLYPNDSSGNNVYPGSTWLLPLQLHFSAEGRAKSNINCFIASVCIWNLWCHSLEGLACTRGIFDSCLELWLISEKGPRGRNMIKRKREDLGTIAIWQENGHLGKQEWTKSWDGPLSWISWGLSSSSWSWTLISSHRKKIS